MGLTLFNDLGNYSKLFLLIEIIFNILLNGYCTHTVLNMVQICCICLASYNDNDELKKLPCSHFFHASCVDTWLRIKAFCPLCKCSIGNRTGESPSTANSTHQG